MLSYRQIITYYNVKKQFLLRVFTFAVIPLVKKVFSRAAGWC